MPARNSLTELSLKVGLKTAGQESKPQLLGSRSMNSHHTYYRIREYGLRSNGTHKSIELHSNLNQGITDCTN